MVAGAANVDFAALPAACATRADSGLRDDNGPRVELVPSVFGISAIRGIEGAEFFTNDVCGDQGSSGS